MKTGLPILLAFGLFLIPGLAETKPNIIYILADDLGYGDLGCYGQKDIQTPHVDRLAKAGIRFTQHYAGSNICAPARCVFITGLHTGHCYIRNNKPLPFEGNAPIGIADDDIVVHVGTGTFAENATPLPCCIVEEDRIVVYFRP